MYKIIGTPVCRYDAVGKVLGSTEYAGDFFLPGMLFAKVVRSPWPSAKILAINTSVAKGLPRVHAVLTAADLPNQVMEVPLLARDTVHFLGEAVALVAAETQEIAERAAQAISIQWTELSGVFDPIEALKDDRNVVARCSLEKGDTSKGLAEADLVLESTYRVPRVDHVCLELEGGVAWVDEREILNIRIATQGIEHFRTVADALNLPHGNVRIIAPMVGGAFGGKGDATIEIYLGLLAVRTKRPVRLFYSRRESFLARPKRHAYIMRYKTGVKRNGQVVVLEAELISDAGAYASFSPKVLTYSAVTATGPYDIPNVKVNAVAVRTNNTPSGAMRGFGVPQACFACECQMDLLARALEMSPLRFREINYLRPGSELPTGQGIDNEPFLVETARRALEALGKISVPNELSKRVGRGMASHMTPYGRLAQFSDTSNACVRMEIDGSVVILCGVPDVGGGQSALLCQIAAEVLGIPMQSVTVCASDSLATPLAGMTRGSRQTYMSGNAVFTAASAVRESLLAKASEMLGGVDPSELDLACGKVLQRGDATSRLTVKEVVAACVADHIPLQNQTEYVAPPEAITSDPKIAKWGIFRDFTFGAHAVEVEVNIQTGEVRVLKSVGCHDVGRAINPASVEGQIEGAALMGQGYALSEEYVLENGHPQNPSLAKYVVQTSVDCPNTTALFVESAQGKGPFGAKGIGEAALAAVAPAIINAVHDATGVRIYELPATAEKVWEGICELERH